MELIQRYLAIQTIQLFDQMKTLNYNPNKATLSDGVRSINFTYKDMKISTQHFHEPIWGIEPYTRSIKITMTFLLEDNEFTQLFNCSRKTLYLKTPRLEAPVQIMDIQYDLNLNHFIEATVVFATTGEARVF